MTKMQDAFVAEARLQGLEVRRWLEDGRAVVAVGAHELTISLENIARVIARDGDTGALERFVRAIRGSLAELPPWDTARQGLRFSAEAADVELGDALWEPVTREVVRVLVFVDPEEALIRWLSPADLATWGVDLPEAHRVAAAGMAALLDEATLEVTPAEGHLLGYLETDSPLKASLIFSPNLKARVSTHLGWPIYAVIPARDFMYLFPKRDQALIPRIGGVVVNEFRGSGYPITTEVLEISDAGIQAIGKYPVSDCAP